MSVDYTAYLSLSCAVFHQLCLDSVTCVLIVLSLAVYSISDCILQEQEMGRKYCYILVMVCAFLALLEN